MRSASTWFAVLVVVCMASPYLLGVRPRSRAQWTLIAITIAFLVWLLPMMAAVRSR